MYNLGGNTSNLGPEVGLDGKEGACLACCRTVSPADGADKSFVFVFTCDSYELLP